MDLPETLAKLAGATAPAERTAVRRERPRR